MTSATCGSWSSSRWPSDPAQPPRRDPPPLLRRALDRGPTIATQLRVHYYAVKRTIESERFIRPGTQLRASLLDPYKGFIGEVLEQYPRLRATRLFEMAKEWGYTGSVVQLRRYVQTVRPAAKTEAFLRLATMPGEQAQVDWGNFGKIQVGHARRALSCFVMVLSWSRAIYEVPEALGLREQSRAWGDERVAPGRHVMGPTSAPVTSSVTQREVPVRVNPRSLEIANSPECRAGHRRRGDEPRAAPGRRAAPVTGPRAPASRSPPGGGRPGALRAGPR